MNQGPSPNYEYYLTTMNKYNTEKEIEDVLKKMSQDMNPRESAFSAMLQKIDVTPVPTKSPYIKVTGRQSIFNSSYFRLASAAAVFMFILGGVLNLNNKNNPSLPVVSTDGEIVASNVLGDTPGQLAINKNVQKITNPAENVQQNIVASGAAVASLKSTSSGAEATDLEAIIASELNAEVDAHADLLALSNI